MAGRSEMNIWRLAAVLLLAGTAAACGGNSTTVGVTITAPGVISGGTATVIANGTLQFAATVTGASATTVYWRICKPAPTALTQPINCTSISGVTPPNTPVLTGYGTITQTGLYTAPPAPPDPNTFVVMAISTVSPFINDTSGTINTDFGVINVQIDSGVRVQVFPTTATIGAGQHIQFTADVTGSTNQSVNWLVNGIAGGNLQTGFICPNPLAPQPCSAGEYFAPASGTSAATISATSAADTSKSGTASVTVSTTAAATLTSIDPIVALQGSAQRDVYLIGANFFSNDTAFVAAPGQSAAAVPTTFISSTLLRATIPANLLSATGQDQISVVRQNGSANLPGPVGLTINPIRPVIVASTPDSFSQNPGNNATLTLTGGFFSPASSALFNGSSVGITASLTSSRQLSLAIPAGSLATPGLYPVVVQNAGISAPAASMSAVNVAVTPAAANIPAAPIATLGVGASPSAVAVDYASGIAMVADTGSNNVSLINLRTTPPAVTGTITVGKAPTGVAIDDLLAHHIAVVVNSGDQTISTIDLTTLAVTSTISVAIGPTAGSPAGPAPIPYSVGINSLTHRAVVAYQSFNEATILDLSTGTPAIVQQIGGDLTAPLGTGTTPAVAVDERLNWAIVTPGGGGALTTNIVDLGHNATGGDVIRAPQVVASLALSTTGVGINTETHQALFTDPTAGNLTSFSLLNATVNSITFMNAGIAVDQLGFSAAATNPLENVGIAINTLSSTAAIVDLESGIVLQTVAGLGTTPQAVAVDPVSNLALVANQGSNSVSIVSLGGALNPLQIAETSPSIAFASTAPLTLTVTGGAFSTSSAVRLDQIPVPTAVVATTCSGTPAVCRQLTATVPASMLGSARNYAVDVAGTGTVSNVEQLTVVQPVIVGNSPVGVAIDTDRDLAVVTNSGSGSVSLVALSPATPVGISQSPAGAVGTVGAPLTVGVDPLGVAVIARMGLAIVANNGSNNASLVDETQTSVPQTVSPCGSTGGSCTGPTAAAINQDTAQAVITNAGILNDTSAPSSISFGTITPATTTAAPTLGSPSTDGNVDQNPVSAAVDPMPIPANPGISYVAVGTASQTSSVEVIDTSTLIPQRVSGFQNPTGMIFDALNQVFVIANSLSNNIVLLDPTTLVQTPIVVGINPTALAYDIQTSTLVTSNLASQTLSILNYTCPPSSGNTACLGPRVQAVLGLGGSQQFSVAIDANLNIAVVADQANNRVLLVPLPH
jgi:DNA-binding beta-propeller fold protein YncE